MIRYNKGLETKSILMDFPGVLRLPDLDTKDTKNHE